MFKSFTLIFVLLLGNYALQAATHIITFGSSLTYSPASLNVAVGDIIKWQGSFSSHPLASTVVPAGAATFSSNTGTSFSYTVTVAGTYAYKCTVHAGAGMVGGFVASPVTNTNDIAEESVMELGIFNGGNTLHLQPVAGANTPTCDLQICNVSGQTVLTAPLAANIDTWLDVQHLPQGIYVISVCDRTKKYLLRRKFLKS